MASTLCSSPKPFSCCSAAVMGAEASTEHTNVPDLPPTCVNKARKLFSRRTKCGGRIMSGLHTLLYRNKLQARKERKVHGKWNPDEMKNQCSQPPKSLLPRSVDEVLLYPNSCFFLPFCSTQVWLHRSPDLDMGGVNLVTHNIYVILCIHHTKTRAIIDIVFTTCRAPSAISLQTQPFQLKSTPVNQHHLPG